jgi:hypothetical protein
MEYDKHVDFYYTNLINSIILYTYNVAELKKLEPILIDPLTELYEELEYAFTPVCFETIFRLGKIDRKLKDDLLEFKKEVESIPKDIWNWEFIDEHETWKNTRKRATEILVKMNIASREYNDDYDVIYDNEGNIIRKGNKM